MAGKEYPPFTVATAARDRATRGIRCCVARAKTSIEPC